MYLSEKLKMATIRTSMGLQFLLNQVAYNKLIKNRLSLIHYYSSPKMVTGL